MQDFATRVFMTLLRSKAVACQLPFGADRERAAIWLTELDIDVIRGLGVLTAATRSDENQLDHFLVGWKTVG